MSTPISSFDVYLKIKESQGIDFLIKELNVHRGTLKR